MEETLAWIAVVDSAIKIGLGALLGGGFGVLVAWLNNKSQVKKGYLERRRQIIEGVLDSVDLASNCASVYWANLANAVYKRDNHEQITPAEYKELGVQENEFFAAFTKLNSSSARLLLLGEGDSDESLAVLKARFNEFFRIANIDNENCTSENLSKHKDAISEAKKSFYSVLGKAYLNNA